LQRNNEQIFVVGSNEYVSEGKARQAVSKGGMQ